MKHDRDKEQLEDELVLRGHLDDERKKSDALYAIKLVEKIVFGLVSLILIAVVTALVALVLK